MLFVIDGLIRWADGGGPFDLRPPLLLPKRLCRGLGQSVVRLTRQSYVLKVS